MLSVGLPLSRLHTGLLAIVVIRTLATLSTTGNTPRTRMAIGLDQKINSNTKNPQFRVPELWILSCGAKGT